MTSTNQRFECQPGCTKCCQAEGFVYVTNKDIERISAHLQLSVEAFEKRYVFRTRSYSRLRVPRMVQCPFLAADGCSIHTVKPLQCRAFPFWPELVDDQRAWHKEGSKCPGIGKGELINIETAQATVREMRLAYPNFYGSLDS